MWYNQKGGVAKLFEWLVNERGLAELGVPT